MEGDLGPLLFPLEVPLMFAMAAQPCKLVFECRGFVGPA